jgi:hypothetical protein
MAHVFWKLRFAKEQWCGEWHRMEEDNEPRMNREDPARELGYAWEQWRFGGSSDLMFYDAERMRCIDGCDLDGDGSGEERRGGSERRAW